MKGTPRPRAARRLLFGVGLAGALLLASGVLAQSERAAREELDSLGREIDSLSSRLTATGQARDSATQALQVTETELAQTHQRLDALQAERRGVEDEARVLRGHRDRLQGERSAQVAALAEQFAALYRLESESISRPRLSSSSRAARSLWAST
ncbi:hypothetical protein BIS12_13675, partial [Halomonas sp. 707D7]|nr:hypothetical protein [Halomonas sp. 707D7]